MLLNLIISSRRRVLHQNVPEKSERKMENRSIGPLTRDHVEGLKGLLELYRSIDSWSFIYKNCLAHGLCLAIQANLGVNVYGNHGFCSFLGIDGGYLKLTPYYYYSGGCRLNEDIIKKTIEPRIEALEKIINYLNN